MDIDINPFPYINVTLHTYQLYYPKKILSNPARVRINDEALTTTCWKWNSGGHDKTAPLQKNS